MLKFCTLFEFFEIALAYCRKGGLVSWPDSSAASEYAEAESSYTPRYYHTNCTNRKYKDHQ